jgi:hypothetical protein
MYYAGFLALMEGKILFERFFSVQKDWNDSRNDAC